MARCKYSNERLGEIIRERGVAVALEDIDSEGVDDPKVRDLWKVARLAMEQIEEQLA